MRWLVGVVNGYKKGSMCILKNTHEKIIGDVAMKRFEEIQDDKKHVNAFQ